WKGSYLEASVAKLGVGIVYNVNIFSTQAKYEKYMQLGKKWYLASISKVKFSLPKVQPFNLSRGLGYNSDYVSGYEYYVINGQSYGYTKLNLKNQLLKFKIKAPVNNPFLNGADLAFALYLRAYIDAGY